MKNYLDFLTLGCFSASLKVLDLLLKGPKLETARRKRIILGKPVIMKGKKGGKNARKPKI
jgi:hypothetical protein